MTINDLVKQPAWHKDNNHCTVTCLAICAGISYEEAYEICKKAGRKHGCGWDMLGLRMCIEQFKNVQFARAIGLDAWRGKQVQNFINNAYEQLSGKTIVVSVKNHVFTVVDNYIHDGSYDDMSQSRKLIRQIWQVG